MTKEKKLTLILFLIILIILIPFGKAKAHSVELDPKSLITFPMMIFNGKGSITIKSSETGYSLYYQAVEISNTIYTQIEKINNDGKTELNSIKTQMDALEKEYDNLKTVYDEAYDAYKEKLDSGVTDTELETLKAKYETAKTNYQNKVTEYNNKLKEYNNKRDEVSAKIKELKPTYVEKNWKKMEDTNFSVDLSQFSGDKAFAIWIKLISSDGTISYDEEAYTMSGTKKEDIKVKGISLNKTTMTLKIGSSYTLIATTTPSDATDKLVIWKSSDENIATVSNGKVTAKSSGNVTITATTNDGSYTASCKVIVSEKADTPKDDDKEDNTTATGKIPQTGIDKTIGINILVISLIIILMAIIFYKKYFKYRDIK